MLPVPRGTASELLFVVWTAALALLPVGVHGQAGQDVTTLDIAAFYTRDYRKRVGGTEAMLASIDLRVAETNGILRKSGALVRIRLVAAQEVDYETGTWSDDLNRFRNTRDGYMDKVHPVRRQVGADVMALIADVKGGTAYTSGGRENAFFMAGDIRHSSVFAHELGHVIGSLGHDRYSNCGRAPCRGSNYGYLNKRAFEEGAPRSARWHTIMAHPARCIDADIDCDGLLRFSNPDQVHPDPGGDPLGVPATDPSTGWDGPADAVGAINARRSTVANFYQAPDIDLSFGEETYTATEGGQSATVTVRLSAAPTRRISVPIAVSGATEYDYVVPSTVEFGRNDTEKTFTVTAVDDAIDESDEPVVLALGESLLRGVTAVGSTTVTLVDNDDSASGSPAVLDMEFVSSPRASGFYLPGDEIEVLVRFDRHVSVTGAARLGLTVGGATRWASHRRTAGEALWFSYAVAEGDLDVDGVSIAADRLDLNGGAIRDGAARDAALGHGALAADGGHAVDAVAPSIKRASVDHRELVLTFDEWLDPGSATDRGAFRVAVDGRAVSVETIGSFGERVTMSVDPPTVAGQTVTLAYTPGAGRLRDRAGNLVAAFSLSAAEIEHNSPAVVYDDDRDGLIEVADLAQLDAIRYDLDGDGFPVLAGQAAYFRAFPGTGSRLYCYGNCSGYELALDLDFDTNGSGAADAGDAYWNGGYGWEPIGSLSSPFGAKFDGAGHTVSNLFIDRPGLDGVGLFGYAGTSDSPVALLRVGLLAVDVRGGRLVGGLVGRLLGDLRDSFAMGRVSGSRVVGGLMGGGGDAEGKRDGVWTSYAAVHVTGEDEVGGLLGGARSGYWRSETSYATGTVTHDGVGEAVGALFGHSGFGTKNSYATGPVIGAGGGGLGRCYHQDRLVRSYWDETTAGREVSGRVGGRSTEDLQAPTRNEGIYAGWATRDWDFGGAREYPALKVDFNGDGRATWQEFGYQLREGPRLTAALPGADGVALSWPAVDTSRWLGSPSVTYNVYRRSGSTLEILAENIDTLRYVDSVADADETFRYQVAAVVAGGEAARSGLVAPGEGPPVGPVGPGGPGGPGGPVGPGGPAPDDDDDDGGDDDDDGGDDDDDGGDDDGGDDDDDGGDDDDDGGDDDGGDDDDDGGDDDDDGGDDDDDGDDDDGDDDDGGGGGGAGGGGGPPPPSGPPRADFTLTADCAEDLCRVRTGLAVTFEDTSTGRVQSRRWDFGDGTGSRNRRIDHVWSSPGFYEVTLSVSDGTTVSIASQVFLVEASDPAGTCVSDAETLCLQDSRYAVGVDWRTADGGSGSASVVHSGTNDSGLFTFFSRENWEVLIKVLDGCALNGHVWVYGASTTDLGYSIRVTDTATGAVKEYRNEPGQPAPAITDATALPEGCQP